MKKRGFSLRPLGLTLFFVLFSLVNLAAGSQAVLHAGRALDVKNRTTLEDVAVLVDGERIASISPWEKFRIPEGAAVLNLENATILPGLIDAHTHLLSESKMMLTRLDSSWSG